jgi:hypothetical protein
MRQVPNKKRETGALKEVWIAHNNLLDYCREISPQQSSANGVYVDRKSTGTSFKIVKQAAAGGDARVVRMRVIAVANDQLSCLNLDDGETLNVAKPFNLRSANWHGEDILYTLEPYPSAPTTLTIHYAMVTPTYRIATIGTYDEHQVIRPQYVPGFSEIFAAGCESSGVSGCDWVDLNADGRAWTMVL